jgi:23S rRNA (uracil1939-C5)-methyltransferase
LGYRRARSHELIDIVSCPVLSPRIVASPAELKAVLGPLLGDKREARVLITETETGLDILIEGVRPAPAALSALAAKAESLDAARLALGDVSITPSGAPTVDLSGVKVSLPAGAFLQASEERGLRILVDGGYRIMRVVPLDQVLFSPHVEVVAHLAR